VGRSSDPYGGVCAGGVVESGQHRDVIDFTDSRLGGRMRRLTSRPDTRKQASKTT
jgi:hypothetical protein